MRVGCILKKVFLKKDFNFLKKKIRLVQDLNLRGRSPTDFKSVPLTALATRQDWVKKTWAAVGIEPTTTRTQSEYHTPRPSGQMLFSFFFL